MKPDSGVFCVQTDSAARLALHIVQQWLRGQHWQGFESLLWVSLQDEGWLYDQVTPLLGNRQKHHRGFELLSLGESAAKGSLGGQAEQLCNLLDSLLVFKPGLVLFEGLDLWLGLRQQGPVDLKGNPLYQSRYARKWARLEGHTLLALVDQELPVWAGYCDGLAQWDNRALPMSTVWWKQANALQSTLWTEPQARATQQAVVLHQQQFGSLGELARCVYNLRLVQGTEAPIVVYTYEQTTLSRGPVLTRLGADEVHLMDISDKPPSSTAPSAPTDQDLQQFGETLHDILTPAQLTVLPARDFAVQSLMVLQQHPYWTFACTLSRLALLPHINALQVARLMNVPALRACVLYTSEAVYLFKCWHQAPQAADLQTWLSSGLLAEASALFGGVVHLQTVPDIEATLKDLSEAFTAVTAAQLQDTAQEASTNFTDLWQNTAQTQEESRPWLNRLNHLLEDAKP